MHLKTSGSAYINSSSFPGSSGVLSIPRIGGSIVFGMDFGRPGLAALVAIIYIIICTLQIIYRLSVEYIILLLYMSKEGTGAIYKLLAYDEPRVPRVTKKINLSRKNNFIAAKDVTHRWKYNIGCIPW